MPPSPCLVFENGIMLGVDKQNLLLLQQPPSAGPPWGGPSPAYLGGSQIQQWGCHAHALVAVDGHHAWGCLQSPSTHILVRNPRFNAAKGRNTQNYTPAQKI